MGAFGLLFFYSYNFMVVPTTIDTETELSAVNSILGAIGQSPVTTLGTVTDDAGNEIVNTFENPEVSFIYNILRECNVDVQNEGWNFNMENHVEFFPDAITNKINIPDNILRLDVTNGWVARNYNVVKRDGFLYDKYDHTDDWSKVASILLDVVYLFPFSELPSAFKRYITAKASTRAATQLVANGELTKLLSQQEALGRASVMEYECNQGQHSMLGFPENSSYTTYQPYRTLAR